MATIDYSVFDRPKIQGETIKAATAVTLNQSFVGINTLSSDAYSLSLKVDGLVLNAATNGPFNLAAIAPRGSTSVTLGAGETAGLTAGDVVILRKNGEFFITAVEALPGGDVVNLTEKTRLDLDTNGTLELPGRIEITGTEGGGSESTQVLTETLWLTELEDFNGWIMSRIKLDPNTTFTAATFGFTATSFEIHDHIDPSNLHQVDRTSPRELHDPVIAPQALTPFTFAFLSNGSGHKSGTKGFTPSVSRFAEQHVPIRLQVNVTAGTDFTSTVRIHGFQTIWSPLRGTAAELAMGVGSVRVSRENFNQFQVGDVVTLYNLTTDVKETQTVASKTGPDTLNFVGTLANSYDLDDIIGIATFEDVDVSAGIGTYYTAGACVYIYEHETIGGTGDFTYQVFQTVQGYTGCLSSTDPRQGPNIAVGLRQNDGVYINTALINEIGTVLTGQPSIFGPLGGALIQPRYNGNGQDDYALNNNNSILWFGNKNEFGAVVSSPYVMDSASSINGDFMFVEGAPSNMVAMFGVLSALRKIVDGNEAGRCDVLDQAVWRMRDCVSSIRNFFRQSTTDVRGLNLIARIENANRAILGGNGASYQVNSPTGVDDFTDIRDANAYGRGVSFVPAISFPGQPLRVTGFNSRVLHAGGGQSRQFRCQAQNIEYIARGVDSYFTQVSIRSALGGPISAESAIFGNVTVCDEGGTEVPGARVQIIDSMQNVVTDEIADLFGAIPKQELVSHKYVKDGASGDDDWLVGEPVPANITEIVLEPFLVLITAPGFTPWYTPMPARPFDPGSSFTLVALLQGADNADEGRRV